MKLSVKVKKDKSLIASVGVKWIQLVLLFILGGFSFLVKFQLWMMLLWLLSLVGLLVCSLIISYLFKHNNPFSSKLCAVKGVFDCDKVLTSTAATVFKNVTWGDIGLMYFCSLFIFLMLASITGFAFEAMFISIVPGTSALIGSFFSLNYQWRIIGSWCKMCLLIVAVIWLQEIVLLLCLKFNIHSNSIDQHGLIVVLVLFCCSICIASAWLLIKPLIKLADETLSSRKQLQLWKRSPSLFTNLLRKTTVIKDEIWDIDFILGDRNAALQLTMAISLNCPACKNAIRNMGNLLNEKICVVIRFRHNPNKNDLALNYILDKYFLAENRPEQERILTTWFETMNLAKCKEKLGDVPVKSDYTELLQRYENWFFENNIRVTPTICLNKHLLPEPFRLPDLKRLIPRLQTAKI